MFKDQYDETETDSGLILMTGKQHPEQDAEVECLPTTPNSVDIAYCLEVLKKRTRLQECDCYQCTKSFLRLLGHLAAEKEKLHGCKYENQEDWPAWDKDDGGDDIAVVVA